MARTRRRGDRRGRRRQPAVATRSTSRIALVAPGFVDLQCNGIGAVDFATSPPEEWQHAERALARRGVTAICPTFVTAPLDAYDAMLAAAAAAIAATPSDGAALVGVHLEGPFLGGAPGAHDPTLVRTVDVEWLLGLLSRHPGLVRVVTLAPEADPGLHATSALAERGIVVALGHTTASFDEALAAADAGATVVTHLFNGMGPLHHRDPGVAGAALDRRPPDADDHRRPRARAPGRAGAGVRGDDRGDGERQRLARRRRRARRRGVAHRRDARGCHHPARRCARQPARRRHRRPARDRLDDRRPGAPARTPRPWRAPRRAQPPTSWRSTPTPSRSIASGCAAKRSRATTASVVAVTRFASALSQHPVASHAVGEAAGEILEALDGDDPDLVVCFASPHFVGRVRRHRARACATSSSRGVLLGMTAVADHRRRRARSRTGPRSRCSPRASRTPAHAGHRSRRAARPTATTIVGWPELDHDPGDAAAPRRSVQFPIDAFLRRLDDDRPGARGHRRRRVGGPGTGRQPAPLDDQRQWTRAPVGVLLDGVEVRTVVSQGCRPIGDPFVVTRAERQPHRASSRVGRRSSACRSSRERGDPRTTACCSSSGLHVGIVVDEHQADFGRGDFLVRNVLGADRETGAIAVGDAGRASAQTVQFHVRDAAAADEDLRELLTGDDGRGARCCSRATDAGGASSACPTTTPASSPSCSARCPSPVRSAPARSGRRRAELPARLHRQPRPVRLS